MSTHPAGAPPDSAGSAASSLEPIALPSAMGTPPSAPSSTLARVGGWLGRFLIRFGVLYVGLFLLIRIPGLIPGLGWITRYTQQFWRAVVPWFGKEVLHLDKTVAFTFSGSGDKLYDWVQVAAMLAFALVGAGIWVWFDRARRGDRITSELARIGLRYALGATMLSYGIAKVLHQQMPAPGMHRLLQPYGESSPMGLLWTFMGQSWVYSAFAGGLECLGGLLLFFRRTTTLGALILVTVMANVFLMNMTFDVPVKLYSAHYLIFALVLAAPDAKRLLNVLVWHRPADAASITRPWPTGRAGRLFTIVKALIVIWILWMGATQQIWRWAERPVPPKSEYYGIYEVERFTYNGEERPPLTTDALRWRRVAVDEENRVTVLYMTDARVMLRLRRGPGKDRITLEQLNTRDSRRGTMTVSRDPSGALVLSGEYYGANIVAHLKRSDDRRLLLRERGFHWISEQPFNR
jgi:uncharacterized membrane protein YphA (DoxX/SURF4 family)